jgi:hypothetical protein
MIADLKPYLEYKESGLQWIGRVPGHWDIRRASISFKLMDECDTQPSRAAPTRYRSKCSAINCAKTGQHSRELS